MIQLFALCVVFSQTLVTHDIIVSLQHIVRTYSVFVLHLSLTFSLWLIRAENQALALLHLGTQLQVIQFLQ